MYFSVHILWTLRLRVAASHIFFRDVSSSGERVDERKERTAFVQNDFETLAYTAGGSMSPKSEMSTHSSLSLVVSP